MDNPIITIKTTDDKLAKSLLEFLFNYNKVDVNSTVIILGEQKNLKTMWEKVLDESDPLWYNDVDEEYDAYDSQDLGR